MKVHNQYGQAWFLAAALIDGPRTFHQLEEYYRIVARRFGMFISVMEKSGSGLHRSDLTENLKQNLQDLLAEGWIIQKNDLYEITEAGREEAQKMLTDLERSGHILQKGTHPETVSKVTLIVHFILAAVKLPAALLSGSVGLLNDALDTLMDGISSLFVFFGVRSGRERLVSYILLIFMSITGLYSLYEAIRRFIHPVPLEGDIGAFAAVSISAALCALLWLYQKYSGLQHSCVPLIAQSIDSRNHIIVAGGVAAGLIAAKFNINLLDQIVGLVVAVLILKGAAELLIDLVRSSGEEEIDLSKYGFQRLDRHRHRQFVRWFLFEIEKGNISTRRQMFEEARAATDFNQIASLRALGLAEQSGREQKIEAAAEEVFNRGLAEEIKEHQADEPEPIIRLTPAGETELHNALNDSWKFTFGKYRSFLVRFLFSALFFTATYAAARWIIKLLNSRLTPLETWNTIKPALFGATDPSLLLQIVTRSFSILENFSIGPITFNVPQATGFLIGLVFFYHGRMLSHQASHLLHHARERTRIRQKEATDKQSKTRSKNRSEKPRYLVKIGPFTRRRHPMYAGHILINLGFGIALHSVYALAWSTLAVIIQTTGAFHEERQLRTWFPDEYPDYCRTVKRRFLSLPLWFIIGITYAAAWFGAFF